MTWLLALTLAGLVDQSASSGDALEALRAGLAEDVEVQTTPAPEVRYCPDNTCEVFRGTKVASRADVADVALLYLWAVSDYVYLESWRQGPQPAAVQAAVLRRGDACSRAAGREALACALRALVKSGGIRVLFVRYDEGAEAEVPVDVDQGLRRLK